MGNSLHKATSEISPDTRIAQALTQALTQTKEWSNVITIDQKIGEINSIRSCAEEVHIVLRLFLWDQNVEKFDDPDTNYWEAIYQRVERIYKYISSLWATDIQRLFLHFGTWKDWKVLMEMADEVRNLIDQDNKIGAKKQFFETFWGKYTISAHGNRREDSIARRVLESIGHIFYIDKHLEFLESNNIPTSILELLPEWSVKMIIDSTENRLVSTLTNVSNPTKVKQALRDGFNKFTTSIQNIPYIQLLLEYIDLLITLEQLPSEMKKKNDELIEVMNYIFEISHKDKQLAASKKRRDFLV